MRLHRQRTQVMSGSSLMLTPMLDVLTVVLIFLILNFAPEKNQLDVSNGVHIPAAATSLNHFPKLKLEITHEGFKINGEPITGLMPQSKEDSRWNLLKDKLQALQGSSSQNLSQDAASNEGLLLIADAESPYDDIDLTVSRLAAMGFSDIYLLTQGEEKK